MKKLLLFSMLVFLGLQSLDAQSFLYGTSAFQDSMWAFDTTTFVVVDREAPVHTGGGTITGVLGSTYDPTTGNYYTICKLNGVSGRVLCMMNPLNYQMTTVGNLGDNFASIMCTPQGNLYAVTGDGATVPETLYKINKTNGTKTFLRTFGNGADGEAIAYCPDGNRLYHASGNSIAIFEKTDTLAGSVTSISTNLGSGEVFGMVYLGGGKFLMSDINSRFSHLDTLGNRTIIATGLPDDIRGPVFSQPLTLQATSDIYSCNATVTFSPTATGGLRGNTVTTNLVSGSTFAQGVTTINVTATDGKGFIKTSSFRVFVAGASPFLMVEPDPIVGTNATAHVIHCATPAPYTLYVRRILAGSSWVTTNVNGNTTTLTNLLPATAYVAYSEDTNGNTSELTYFVTSGTPGCSDAIPSNISASQNCQTITVNWTGSSTKYNSYVRLISPTLGASSSLVTTNTSRTFNASTSGGIYEISVFGMCGNQYTPAAQPIYLTSPDLRPIAPTLSVGAVTCNAITLNWNAVSGASGYRVRIINNVTNSVLVNAVTTNLTFTKTGLASNFTYKVSVTPLGCNNIAGFTSNQFTVTTCSGVVNPAKYSEPETMDELSVNFNLFPNPNKGEFMINAENLTEESAKISIANITGQILKNQEVRVYDSRIEESINVSELPSGMYIFTFQQGDFRKVMEFFIE